MNKLMQMPELQDFALVGGTALSLLYGHRMSVDLDLFSNKSFENAVLCLRSKIPLAPHLIIGLLIHVLEFSVLSMR